MKKIYLVVIGLFIISILGIYFVYLKPNQKYKNCQKQAEQIFYRQSTAYPSEQAAKDAKDKYIKNSCRYIGI